MSDAANLDDGTRRCLPEFHYLRALGYLETAKAEPQHERSKRVVHVSPCLWDRLRYLHWKERKLMCDAGVSEWQPALYCRSSTRLLHPMPYQLCGEIPDGRGLRLRHELRTAQQAVEMKQCQLQVLPAWTGAGRGASQDDTVATAAR